MTIYHINLCNCFAHFYVCGVPDGMELFVSVIRKICLRCDELAPLCGRY